jgi:signal transduction histidine kinase
MDLLRPNMLTPATGGLDAERTRQFLDCVFRVLAHDLPNHLIALRGLARLLAVEEEERLSTEGKEYVDRMASAAERAHTLAVSLSSTGRLLLQPPTAEAVDLGEAIAEPVAVVKALCPQHAVEYDLPHEPVFVTVPRLSLDHVLVCLLRRAFSLASGRCPIHVKVEPNAERDAVEVSVSAASITPSDDASSERDLFLARLLVEAWGGRIRLFEEPATRQTVFVTCPR